MTENTKPDTGRFNQAFEDAIKGDWSELDEMWKVLTNTLPIEQWMGYEPESFIRQQIQDVVNYRGSLEYRMRRYKAAFEAYLRTGKVDPVLREGKVNWTDKNDNS